MASRSGKRIKITRRRAGEGKTETDRLTALPSALSAMVLEHLTVEDEADIHGTSRAKKERKQSRCCAETQMGTNCLRIVQASPQSRCSLFCRSCLPR